MWNLSLSIICEGSFESIFGPVGGEADPLVTLTRSNVGSIVYSTR